MCKGLELTFLQREYRNCLQIHKKDAQHLISRRIQIIKNNNNKNTMRYNFTSIRMATIKMIEIITKDFGNKSAGKDVEKLELLGSMVGI